MKLLRIALLLCSATLLHGCVVAKPATLPQNFWTETNKSISVSVQDLPKPSSNKLGAQGLIDIAINQMVATGWDNHVENLKLPPYGNLAGEFVTRLNQRGFKAQAVSMKLASLPRYEARPEQKTKKAAVLDKDLSGVTALTGSDYLLLVNPVTTGTARNYYGFIPLSDPTGFFLGHATLIDVKSNEIKWWKDIMISKIANIPWDEPPGYPNLSQAIVQAVEESREQFMTELFSSAPAALPATPAAPDAVATTPSTN